MKKILLAAICAASLSAYALPTYEPFTEYAGQLASSPVTQGVTSASNVPVGTNANSGITNCLDLATGGLVAPSGEAWVPLYFSGGGGGGTSASFPWHGLDVAVISNATIFTAANLGSLLPSTFPGFPAVGGGITNIAENPAQPLVWNGTSFVASNYCGNSAVLKFASAVTRPVSGTRTLYVSYLFAISQQGQLGGGNDGRYLAFLSSSNLSEGFTGGSPVPGAAYTNFFLLFDTFNGGTAAGVHYASHGLLAGGSGAFIGPCDSSAGKSFAGSSFSTAFNNTPNFVVGAYVMNASGKDTNIVWVNPTTAGFGGTTPPASPIFATNMISSNLTDLGGLCLIDRSGNGQLGGVGTNYVANLIIGSTWSYVTGGPEFTTQPVASAALNPGDNETLTAAATAAGQSVTYQWQKVVGGVTNNVNNGPGGAGGAATISGATTGSLTFTGFGGGDVGTYQALVTASGTTFTLTSSQSSLSLADPQITANPANTSGNFGGSASLTAQVSTVSAPLTFQWYKGSTPLSNGAQPDGSTATGATGTTGAGSSFTLTLTLSGISYQDAGSYSVAVTNSGNFGKVSGSATLTVNDPIINSQPSSSSLIAGGTATFTVSASGSPTLGYQWAENGTNLTDGQPTPSGGSATVSGSQTATLTLTGVQDGDDGNYTCLVTSSGSGQSTNSAAAALVVQDALSISVPLRSLTERVGDHTAFSVGVLGGGPSYSWTFNGNPIPGATGSSLVLTNIQTGSNGTYAVSIHNLVTTTPITSSGVLTVINSSILNVSPANLLVARVGDGAQPLSAVTGNTIYLDQYNSGGTYLNTIQVPDEGTGQTYGTGSTKSSSMPIGSPALLVAGAGSDAGYEAMLNLSANNEYISFAGYCQAYPYSGLNNVNTPNTSPASWRGLATINAFGTYNLAYTNSGLYSGGSALIRDVFTLEGSNFWTTGAASAGTVKFVNSGPAGAAYANGGGVPSSSGVSGAGGQGIQIVNGALPAPGFSSAENLVVADSGVGVNNGLYAATNEPEPSAGNITFIPLLFTGTTSIPGDFAFSPDNLTVYVADSGAYTGSAGTGGIERWDSTGNGWALSYTLPVINGLTNGAQNLVVDFSASPTWGSAVTGAKIYATSYGATTNSLVMMVDNGNTSTPTVLATAGPNQALRGVRFGPAVILPAIVTAPQNQTNFPGNSVTFTVAASGSGPLTYQWSYNSTPISGATGTSFTTNNISMASAGNYSVTVGNPNNQTASATAILTVTAGAPTISPTTLPNYTETAGDHVGWGPTVNGTLPVTNYWYFGSVSPANLIQSNVSAAPVATLSLANVQISSNGTYILVTSNQFGHATASGTLTVTTSPQTISTANLVVARIGDGAQPLSGATGNTLYLDQYTALGGYVNTIQIPDEGTGQPYGTGGASTASMPFGSPALLVAGAGNDAANEALLTLSPAGPNGQTLAFGGYCQAYPFAGADVSATGSTNWRGVAVVDGYGHYAISYTNTGLYNGGLHQIHGAIDIDGSGTNFYTTGEAGGGFGVKYLNTDFEPANGNGIASVTGSFGGTRVARIINGNLTFSDGAGGPNGIYGVSGLPTNTMAPSLLIAETNNPMDFAVSPDGTTVYIADNGTFGGTSAQLGGIQRWDGFAPNSYTYSYTLSTGTSAGARGLTADFSANANWGAGVHGAKLYATTAETSGNRLIEITDNGVGSAATVLTTAATGQILSGVRFGPATVAAVVNASPQNESGFVGANVTFSGQLNGSQPLTYQWFFQANCAGGFTMINNATNATLTVNNISSANVGCYEVTITNPGGSATSTPATLTLNIPPHFTSETFLGVGSGIQLNFIGTAGVGYSIWTSTDLTLAPIQSTWTKLTTGTFSGSIDTFTDTSAGVNPNKYYIISVP